MSKGWVWEVSLWAIATAITLLTGLAAAVIIGGSMALRLWGLLREMI